MSFFKGMQFTYPIENKKIKTNTNSWSNKIATMVLLVEVLYSHANMAQNDNRNRDRGKGREREGEKGLNCLSLAWPVFFLFFIHSPHPCLRSVVESGVVAKWWVVGCRVDVNGCSYARSLQRRRRQQRSEEVIQPKYQCPKVSSTTQSCRPKNVSLLMVVA